MMDAKKNKTINVTVSTENDVVFTTPVKLPDSTPINSGGQWYECTATVNYCKFTAVYHVTEKPKIRNLFRGTIDLLSICSTRSEIEYCRYVDGWVKYPVGDAKIVMQNLYEKFGKPEKPYNILDDFL